ncbi:MAG: hypothetical protein R8P61_08580 [Bacteroidia bacterium]|nr:hypothetical protein [Bacteroidia bacterium]
METDPDILSWQQGKNEYLLMIDGYERNFIIHVPASYQEDIASPVVFMLHGSGGNGTKFHNISGWKEKGEAEGFITVFPTAMEYRLADGRNSTKWGSRGLESELAAGESVKDDIPFFEELVRRLKLSFKLDERRLYISGFSNGSGFVKSEIVPRMGDTFAAANVSGGVGIPVSFPISGNRIMPVFNISGSMDPKILEKIGSNEELPLSGPDIEAHSFLWSSLTTMCEMLGLQTDYTENPNIPLWNLMTFTSPQSSQASEYKFMMVKEMAHVYPNGGNNPRGVVAVDILWPWFLGHQLN